MAMVITNVKHTDDDQNEEDMLLLRLDLMKVTIMMMMMIMMTMIIQRTFKIMTTEISMFGSGYGVNINYTKHNNDVTTDRLDTVPLVALAVAGCCLLLLWVILRYHHHEHDDELEINDENDGISNE